MCADEDGPRNAKEETCGTCWNGEKDVDVCRAGKLGWKSSTSGVFISSKPYRTGRTGGMTRICCFFCQLKLGPGKTPLLPKSLLLSVSCFLLVISMAQLFGYALTLMPPSVCNTAVVGQFSGSKQQEILVSHGSWLEMLRMDPASKKVLSSPSIFCIQQC